MLPTWAPCDVRWGKAAWVWTTSLGGVSPVKPLLGADFALGSMEADPPSVITHTQRYTRQSRVTEGSLLSSSPTFLHVSFWSDHYAQV